MLLKFKANNLVECVGKVSIFLTSVKYAVVTNLFVFLFAGTTITPLYATEREGFTNAQKLNVHGFLSQGVIDVDGSDFVNDDGELSAELTELGINASYKLNEDLRFAAQVVYLDGGNRYAQGIRLDYALVDWSVYADENWQANIYLGRFKNNHWLYSSSRDVPFARPSIILPQSVYFDGFRDIAVGSDGIAAKVSHSTDEYGNFDWQISYGTSPISHQQTKNILSEYATGDAKQDYDFQSSFYWQPGLSSWRFGISLLDASFSYDSAGIHNGDIFFDANFNFQFYTLNALYEAELWEFSGEIYQQRFTIDGFYHANFDLDNIGQGFYLQSRYKLSQRLTLLARYENFYLDKDDKNGKKLEQESGGQIPYYFGFHKDITLGVNIDISSNFSARMEYHWVNGAGRLTPVVAPNPKINNAEDWQMWALQLMYWF